MAASHIDRRLAAIMAADVVGYSALMERDEDGTLARLKAHRQEFIEPLIAEYQGRIVKLIGDGALIEFASVVAAVRCAVRIQRGMVEREAEVPKTERIWFRIGINLGDVIREEDGDLYGDGVNVAARLEQLAEPGGVVVSGTAYDHLQGKLDLPLEFAGEQRVKNIERLVRAYRVRLDGKAARFSLRRVPRAGRQAVTTAAVVFLLVAAAAGGWWWRQAGERAGPPLPAEPSIAVLPFENHTGEERLGRLADGMVGDIIADLSKAGMFVIGRGTSFTYRNKQHGARSVGRDLGVRYLLEGGLDGDGKRIRATVGLVDTATGAEVWSERYDRPLDDLFVVHDELTQRIVDSLGRAEGVIRRAQTEAARGKPADSLQAFDLLLLGRAAFFRNTREDNTKALELLQRAVYLDPNLARAYMNLAGVYEQQVLNGWTLREQAMASWQAAARKAVQLAPENAWGRYVQARWYLLSGQPAAYAAELQRAAELVEDSQLMLLIAGELPLVGQSARGAELAERGLRLDPNAIDRYRWALQQAYFFAHRFEEAAATSEAIAEPDSWDALHAMLAYAQLGRAADTERWRSHLLGNDPDFSAERLLRQNGDFVLPQAAAERALWLGSLAKTGLPMCATLEQLTASARPVLGRLPECEAERKAAAVKL